MPSPKKRLLALPRNPTKVLNLPSPKPEARSLNRKSPVLAQTSNPSHVHLRINRRLNRKLSPKTIASPAVYPPSQETQDVYVLRPAPGPRPSSPTNKSKRRPHNSVRAARKVRLSAIGLGPHTLKSNFPPFQLNYNLRPAPSGTLSA